VKRSGALSVSRATETSATGMVTVYTAGGMASRSTSTIWIDVKNRCDDIIVVFALSWVFDDI